MSRPLRIEYNDAWYHIMNRGRRSEKIFLDISDYLSFFKVLEEAVDLWKIHICAYCLMPNHYHLLIQTPKANISRCMRHINGVYTQRFNRTYKTDGQLFRGRYKSILVGEEEYLLELFRYICFNPVKAGIVKKPGQYQWSSYNDFLVDSNNKKWLSKDFFLDFVVGKDRKHISESSLPIVDASTEIYEFFNKKNLLSVLGSQTFIDKIRTRFFKNIVHSEIPELKDLELKQSTIIKHVCSYHGISEQQLYIRKRGSTNIPSDLAIYLIRTNTCQTLSDIGKTFGIDKYSSVSSAIERFKLRLKNDKNLQNAVKRIERNIR